MGKQVVLSELREIPLLLFLWKWKVSTTAALIKKFFPNCKEKTAYNRILALRHAGLIQVRSDCGGQKFICALDEKGFDHIRTKLPFIGEDGFKSEHMGHDLLVAAFQMGNWLLESPQGIEFFSEQQLRRTKEEYYPAWVPKSATHRPDGYTRLTLAGKSTTVAIEVELSHKSDAEYLRIAEHYDLFRTVARVLWLVPRRATAHTLHAKMKAETRRQPFPHDFVVFEEFQNRGWDARIIVGPDEGKSLSDFYSEVCPKSGGLLPDSCLAQALLDLRKSPHVAITYRGYELGDFPT